VKADSKSGSSSLTLAVPGPRRLATLISVINRSERISVRIGLARNPAKTAKINGFPKAEYCNATRIRRV
jgi:hypothetical protein